MQGVCTKDAGHACTVRRSTSLLRNAAAYTSQNCGRYSPGITECTDDNTPPASLNMTMQAAIRQMPFNMTCCTNLLMVFCMMSWCSLAACIANKIIQHMWPVALDGPYGRAAPEIFILIATIRFSFNTYSILFTKTRFATPPSIKIVPKRWPDGA